MTPSEAQQKIEQLGRLVDHAVQFNAELGRVLGAGNAESLVVAATRLREHFECVLATLKLVVACSRGLTDADLLMVNDVILKADRASHHRDDRIHIRYIKEWDIKKEWSSK